MRQMIWCCTVAALGAGLYGLVRYSKSNPGSVPGQCVTTACEVGERSNPFATTREPDQELARVPGAIPPPGTSSTPTLEEILADPQPVGQGPGPAPLPLPASPGLDGPAPIVIQEPEPVGQPTGDVIPLIPPVHPVSVASPAPETEVPGRSPVMPYCPAEQGEAKKTMPYVEDGGPAGTAPRRGARRESGARTAPVVPVRVEEECSPCSGGSPEEEHSYAPADWNGSRERWGSPLLRLLFPGRRSGEPSPLFGGPRGLDTMEFRASDGSGPETTWFEPL